MQMWSSLRSWHTKPEKFVEGYQNMHTMPNKIEENDPLSGMFVMCVTEWARFANKAPRVGLARIQLMCDLHKAKWLAPIQVKLNHCNAIASIAPYIGVLGTIISLTCSMSEPFCVESALYFTACGLVVSVIATWFSYYFACEFEQWERRLEGFSQRVSSDLMEERY